MLYSLALKISQSLMGNDADRDQLETCAYGVDIFLYTLISTVGLVLIGCACHRFAQTAMLILVYYLNQASGGGYHATSHIQCFLSMAFGLIICIFAFRMFVLDRWAICTLAGLSLIPLWVMPAVIHPNKAYLQKKYQSIRKRSRVIAASSFVFSGLLSIQYPELGEAAAMGMFVALISRIAADVLLCPGEPNCGEIKGKPQDLEKKTNVFTNEEGNVRKR